MKGLGEMTVLFLTGHDYRSPRRVSTHFFAEEALKIFDRVSFFSVGFSYLSLLKGDPRVNLFQKANSWQVVDGVECYLWKTPIHPVSHTRLLSSVLCDWTYKVYSEYSNSELDRVISEATTIYVESGLSPVFLPRVRRLNPGARLIYDASDLLDTIGVDPFVARTFEAHVGEFSRIRVPSRAMQPAFENHTDAVRFLPHGLKPGPSICAENPYGDGRHAVSVGSMLFDADLFKIVAPKFPDVTFHVIGAGQTHAMPPNVKQYGEMPFRETLPYIQYADVGLAPYKQGKSGEYLADSSLKLRQYGAAGVPAVCPDFAVGDYQGRFGYATGDLSSAIPAMRAALSDARTWPPQEIPTWEEVTRQLFDFGPDAIDQEARK